MNSSLAVEENRFLQESLSSSNDRDVLREILRAIGETPKGVYYPNDDSFLMLDAIADVAVEAKEVLDLGTGSGILGLFCAMRGALVTVADIDEIAVRQALKAAKSLGVRLMPRVSDLFSNVSGKFDLVLFNPPYLPSSEIADGTIDGGPNGTTLAKRFLHDLPNHLKEYGTALLLLSSLNEPTSLIDEHPEIHFSLAKKRALFFEELQVLCLRLREQRTGQRFNS